LRQVRAALRHPRPASACRRRGATSGGMRPPARERRGLYDGIDMVGQAAGSRSAASRRRQGGCQDRDRRSSRTQVRGDDLIVLSGAGPWRDASSCDPSGKTWRERCPWRTGRCSVGGDTAKSLTCRAGFGWLESDALDPGSASSR
jgi:hypothetical protein